jgi:hypothetical protein
MPVLLVKIVFLLQALQLLMLFFWRDGKVIGIKTIFIKYIL